MFVVNQLIKDLRAESGKIAKVGVLKAHDCHEVREALLAAYDPYKNYYVSTPNRTVYGCPIGADRPVEEFDLDLMYGVLEELSSRKFTGNAAKDRIRQTYSCLPKELGEVFLLILGKDIEAGVDKKIINSTYAGIIPTFDIMLAQNGEPEYPCYADVKYDGVRCTAFAYLDRVDFFGRSGNQAMLPNLEKAILKLSLPGTVFEGELIGLPCERIIDGTVRSEQDEDRQKVSGRFNKCLKNPKEAPLYDSFLFILFDMIPFKNWVNATHDPGYESRRRAMQDATKLPIRRRGDTSHGLSYNGRLRLADSRLVKSKEEADEFFKLVRSHREEGCLFKAIDGKYEWKRSKNWIKRKNKETLDLEVIGFTKADKGKRKGKINALECATSCGGLKTFLGSGFTEADIEALGSDVVGKIVEVEYNEIVSKEGSLVKSLFHPVFKGFRNDKTEADSL